MKNLPILTDAESGLAQLRSSRARRHEKSLPDRREPADLPDALQLVHVALPMPLDASALSKLNSWRLLKLIKIKSARSRLYRSRFLQVNTRWKALAEIYTMHSFAPFSNLNFFVKNC